MLALTLSLITAVFLLGPDLISRYILGFVAPKRTIDQSKSEEIMRAILTALFPLAVAVLWIQLRHVVDWNGNRSDLQNFFSGIYSEKFFEDSPPRFFGAAGTFCWISWAFAWRLYAVLIVYAVGIDVLIWKYGNIRHSWPFAKSASARNLLATFILPRISEWHVILKSFSHKKSADIRADVLTKGNVLYRGRIERLLLERDGSLAGLYLLQTYRYRREHYLDDVKAGKNPNPEQYWKIVPSHGFLVMASDISTINLRQYDPPADPELARRLQEILKKPIRITMKVEQGKPLGFN